MTSLTSCERLAFATLITRRSYLAGVVILAHTLRKQGSQYPLIVCYTPNLSNDAVRALELEAETSSIVLRQCAYLLPPEGTEINLIAQRFEDTWTKLRVFELFDYDTVCYLDADMAMFRNMDSVFEYASCLPQDWIAANHACVCNLDSDPWAPKTWRPQNCAYTPLTHPQALTESLQPAVDSPETYHLLNGGMFLFHPTPELWGAMLELFNTTPLLSTFKFPDQDFLALFFKEKWRALGWQYNAIKTMRYWHPNIWRDDSVICLHYIVDKPWTKRIGKDGIAGYKGQDGETHQWWWKAYELWEIERTGLTGDVAEQVDIVKKVVAASRETSDSSVDVEDDPDMKALGSAVQGFANNQTIEDSRVLATIKC